MRTPIRMMLLGVALAAASARMAGAEATGHLCIDRFGPDPPASCPTGRADHEGNPVREATWESVFTVQVGSHPGVQVGCLRSAEVRGLALGKRHRVTVSLDGKRIQTFFFGFEDRGANDLCLYYGPFYGTWRLEAFDPGTKRPCSCRPSRE